MATPNVKIEWVNCRFPLSRFPYYHAEVRIRNGENQNYYINKVLINGKGCRDFVIFKGTQYIHDPIISSETALNLVGRADWENSDQIRVAMELVSADGKSRFEISYDGRTPTYGGYWNKNWKYYSSLVIREEFGLDRFNQPVHTTVSLYKDRLNNPEKEIRVVAIDPVSGVPTEIPSQVSEVYVCDTEPDVTKQPSISFDIAFYADVKAYEQKPYLLFYGNPEAQTPEYENLMKVSDETLGKTLENPFYKIMLHPKSGVLDEITVKMGSNRTFIHKLETNGAVHWNPGIYSPPRAWTHASDWSTPEGHFFHTGPVFTLMQLWSPLPLYPETMVSITYIFYSRTPFIRMSSTLEILENIQVQALRNGEIVFNHDLAKEFAWRNKQGEINTVTIKKLPRFEEIPLTIAADTPWTVYYNNENRAAFGMMTLNLANTRKQGGLVKLEKYEQMMNWGPWTYISRTLIFPFGSQNPQRFVMVPKSSLYYEDMVFMPFAVSDSREPGKKFQHIEEWYRRLSNPLSLLMEMDTDKRVPPVFVLGQRLEGEIEEAEEKDYPIDISNEFTRFRQSPSLLNEKWFREVY